jgi:hypothetical protein
MCTDETRLCLPDETYEQIKRLARSDAHSRGSAIVVPVDEYLDRRRRERYEAMGKKIAQRDRDLLDRLDDRPLPTTEDV